ncbi:hypothetical protein [Nocardiopsis sp. RV163]|uniref:hypothetical protein n=1 Tax=Nocardiopsis sp. RV163 TaxID=1661388 RepID=UPI00064B9B33|nr:hypothetical protein [Nocardiopsis sp. RV163]
MTTTPETAVPAEGKPSAGFLSPVLTGTTLVVLLLLGAAAGMLATTGAGWLTLHWGAGTAVRAVGAVGLLAFLVLLYGACRLCAWGSRRASGAAAFALGYLAVLIGMVGYMPGGDIVLTNHIMHNAYLFGVMLVLVFAVIRSWSFAPPPGSPRTAAPGADAPPAAGGYQRTRPSGKARPWREG